MFACLDSNSSHVEFFFKSTIVIDFFVFCKVEFVFPIVISSEFQMEQYRDGCDLRTTRAKCRRNGHKEEAAHFKLSTVQIRKISMIIDTVMIIKKIWELMKI